MKLPESTEVCCWTCRHSTFTVTANGKPKRDAAGRCHCPPPTAPIVVPYFIATRFKDMLATFLSTAKFWPYGIWPADGKDCQGWESKG